MVKAAPKRPPPTSTNLHKPPPTSASLRDASLERPARSFRPVVPPLERRHVQRHRRQVVEQDRPWGERAHRGAAFQVPLAALAHRDLARLLARLRREIAEVVVLGLIAKHAAQQRDRPSRAAAPAAQLPLALEPGVFGHHRPCPTQRTVPLPPRDRKSTRLNSSHSQI